MSRRKSRFEANQGRVNCMATQNILSKNNK